MRVSRGFMRRVGSGWRGMIRRRVIVGGDG